jgi:hypothetical protein
MKNTSFVGHVLKTLVDEGDVEITFILTCGVEIKINQKTSPVATCLYRNGYPLSRYYTINKNGVLVVYNTEDGEEILHSNKVLYTDIIRYTVEYL